MRMRETMPKRPAANERGAALLVSLVVLLTMTVLGVTASRTGFVQERMAGNMRNKALAFEAAETALRQGESWLDNQLGGAQPTPVSPSSCASPPCNVLTQNSLDPMADATWSGNDVRTGQQLAERAQPYRFYVERQQVVRESMVMGKSTDERAQVFYEVYAQAVGSDTSAVSILRSSYVLRF